MKKLILVLALLFISTSSKAENNPKNSKDIKDIKDPKEQTNDFLKIHLKLSGQNKQDKSETECDMCGCYMGIEPNFSKNQVGLRYYTFKFFSPADPETAAETQTDNTGLPNQVNHEEHSSSTEYYNNVELYGRIYISPKMRVIFGIPFKFNKIDNKELNGMGDMRVLGQYQVYNTNITGKTVYWQRVFLGGGLKLPTGVYNKQLVYGITEPHFQPGTGSLDLIVNGLYMGKLEKLGIGWRNDIAYTFTTTNKNEYQFANRFNAATTFSYDLNVSSLTMLPHAGLYYETANSDKLNGKSAAGSGGNVLFVTSGVDFYYKLLSLDVIYELPISENLYDAQPENRYRLYLGLGYSF